MYNPFDLIPDVDFVPKTTDQMIEEMTADYEAEYLRATGERITLPASSEERLMINTEAYRFFLAYQRIDRGLKMNLLKYSTGAFLDNLGALFGLARLPAQRSVSRVRFTLSAPQPAGVRIPGGTRVATQDRIYFRTQADVIIAAGELTGVGIIHSEDAGLVTSGIPPGKIDVLVNPVAYVSEVSNTEPTQGGVEIESDEAFRLRIYYIRDSYSVAGPENAYRYFVRSHNQAIEGIGVFSPEPGAVDIRITLTGGVLPQQSFLDELYQALEGKRPLTDHLTIAAPDVVEYDVECAYYIARSNLARQSELKAQIEAAVQAYLRWQSSTIGRDVTPDMLTKLMVEAGAKRVPILSPAFTRVDRKSIPKHRAVTVTYGGLEDD